MSDTLARLKLIIGRELDWSPEEIKPSDDLTEDPGGDDLSMVAILLDVEEEFKVTFKDGDLPGPRTVGELAAVIEHKQKVAA